MTHTDSSQAERDIAQRREALLAKPTALEVCAASANDKQPIGEIDMNHLLLEGGGSSWPALLAPFAEKNRLHACFVDVAIEDASSLTHRAPELSKRCAARVRTTRQLLEDGDLHHLALCLHGKLLIVSVTDRPTQADTYLSRAASLVSGEATAFPAPRPLPYNELTLIVPAGDRLVRLLLDEYDQQVELRLAALPMLDLGPDLRSHLQRYGSVLLQNGYWPVPIEAGQKRPTKEGWPALRATEKDIDRWPRELPPGVGVGVLAFNTPGIDVDVRDAEMADHMRNVIARVLGSSYASRIGMAPKFLVAVRTDTPFRKLTSRKFRSLDGREHRVEILGDGQQYVVAHVHPDTKEPYRWHFPDGRITEGLDISRASLPEITLEQARQIVDEFEMLADLSGWEPLDSRTPRDSEPRPMTPPQEVTERTVADLRAAFTFMPSDDRDTWQRMGHAVKRLGDIGHELWIEWSRKSPKFDEADAERVWDSLEGARTDYRAVFAEAARQGWQNPYVGAEPTGPGEFSPLPARAVSPSPAAARDALSIIQAEFKPVRFTVDNLLPEGVFLLASNPKVGKSWLALQIALAVGEGGTVLNERAVQGDVLVLALEDNDRRLKKRMLNLGAESLPEDVLRRIDLHTEWPRINEGGAQRIEAWLDARPGARLVVIDVLEFIRPPRSPKANPYAEDYEALRALKEMAGRRQISILVVHHTRKAAADDALQRVSGTQGLSGAADGVWVLERARGEARGALHIMARDLDREGVFAVEFLGGRWIYVGPAALVKQTREREEILDVLRKHGTLKRSDIAAVTGRNASSVGHMLAKLLQGGLVRTVGHGVYAIADDVEHEVADLALDPTEYADIV